MPSIHWNYVVNAFQKILSISSHKVFVVTIFTDVSGHENGLNHDLVQKSNFRHKRWVVLLVVNEAFLIIRKVSENRVFLFVYVVESSWLKSFTGILIHVIEVDLEVVLEDLSWGQPGTVEMKGWYVDST